MSSSIGASKGLGVRRSTVSRPSIVSRTGSTESALSLDPGAEHQEGFAGFGGHRYPPGGAGGPPGDHYPPYYQYPAPHQYGAHPHYPYSPYGHYPPPPPPPTTPTGRSSVAGNPEGVNALRANLKKYRVVLIAESFSESAGRCGAIQKIIANLGVDERTELYTCVLDTRHDGAHIKHYVTHTTGYTSVPVLFVGGTCVGDYTTILSLTRSDQLRSKLMNAGVKSVVSAIPSATLENNIYGYPKSLGIGQSQEDAPTLNVLIACCGSSAADKIPTLVERCVAENWSVKLLCTTSGEHFFKSFGMERIIQAIGAENVYRDEDEWSFEYDHFDMPVRACHLAIRKWADVMVVAPITCNSMAKACAGIGDNLLSSVFVAWEYHKKPILFCPACNVDMWNNAPTQRNVAFLKTMGVEFLGPRVDRLTNGQVAIGCMETVDKIVLRLQKEECDLLIGDEWYFRRAKQAALTDNETLWNLVIRAVEEKLINVNATAEEGGNTLIHLAAGGESWIDNCGEAKWGTPDLAPMQQLIRLGADVNVKNEYDFTPLQVAIAANDPDAVQLLVRAGANCRGVLVDFPETSPEVKNVLATKEESSQLATKYYFTYGSLKQGFPNYKNHEKHLHHFVGAATTVEAYPLVVPFAKTCTNPNCPFLHQQASLCNHPGTGKKVIGEVFVVELEDIVAFDKLEAFNGLGIHGNVYSRRIIDVDIQGQGIVKAYVYFSTSDDPMLQVAAGDAEFVDEYLLDMAKGELKPGYEENAEKGIKRRSSIVNITRQASQSRSMVRPGKVKALEEDFEGITEQKFNLSLSGSDGSDVSSVSNAPRRLTKTPVGVYDKVLAESIGSVQQTINTCNLASITLSLKGLGVTCDIDDIFSNLRLPVCWVIEQGLTLSQVFDLMVKLSSSTNSSELLAPGVMVTCFHFDEAVADYDSFLSYLDASLNDEDDVLIANFNTKIARSMEHGGGHFSLISGYCKKTKTVSIADVHPMKYGAHWACGCRKLFNAMVDRDCSSKRARGLIRVAHSNSTHIPDLDACHRSISFGDPMFCAAEKLWLSRWGDLPAASFESHLNMGGLAALGLALSGLLSEDDYESLALQNYVGADFITWTLRLSITDLLSEVITPRSLANYARRIGEALSINLAISCEEADLSTPKSLGSFLASRIGRSRFEVAMVLVDLNEAHGFEVLSSNKNCEASALDHGSQHWCVLVSVPFEGTAIIADPCAKTFGRLWKCTMSNLHKGLLGAEKSPGSMVFIRPVPTVDM